MLDVHRRSARPQHRRIHRIRLRLLRWPGGISELAHPSPGRPARTYRECIRRNGKPGNGPLRLSVREEVLTRLLTLQQTTGFELISRDEIALIKQIWISDTLIDAPADDRIVVDLPMPVVRPATEPTNP